MSKLTHDELTERFYSVKEQRDRYGDFCQAVLPTTDRAQAIWDHQTGKMYAELLRKDRERLLELLDEAASFCPVPMQDRIRQKTKAHTASPSRLLEALKAIADPEHCLTAFTVQGLRDIAVAALQEIDPRNDYSKCTGPGKDQ